MNAIERQRKHLEQLEELLEKDIKDGAKIRAAQTKKAVEHAKKRLHLLESTSFSI